MGAYKSTNKLKSQSEWRFHILLNNDLRLNLFGLETQYHFDMLVFIWLQKAIYAYFGEV